ncbi:23S rRNA pseudouridine synthase F [Candidatus Uhrbacteria bacterium CG10_big_fil_rev_8_21_14_0_10_48_16]|uniref:Pseudouridine synthase n=1 Tax=Candidatus Uhrbacteria bacterium CG10_big_fil_rev_8_21_14_0_10_48_16 TaxID=1975038 RepID=A0A2M8LI86_9BACT|nr:MAG: 23S rRNA pseudouridine synthase F [Candidatus Uhrbacteria bacterium CG10_big_fil_rev_8_21_14_0_10_48_16]
MKTRLNKYLAERGVCSRRQADALIHEGKVRVNGAIATLGLQVGDDDEVIVSGKPIGAGRPKKVYMAFHKPVGIMTSVDPRAPDTIRSFLNLENHLFPVGRLDVASSGLLILTNDGDLSEHITHPRYNHEKEYIVTVDRPVRREDLRIMAEGMMILGSMTKPAKVKKIGDQRFTIILTEGRNRQIRRMCEELGYGIQALKRIRVMNIELGDLPVGRTRPLTQQELRDLKKRLGL